MPWKAEVATFLKRDAASYDLIFADPPYLEITATRTTFRTFGSLHHFSPHGG